MTRLLTIIFAALSTLLPLQAGAQALSEQRVRELAWIAARTFGVVVACL